MISSTFNVALPIMTVASRLGYRPALGEFRVADHDRKIFELGFPRKPGMILQIGGRQDARYGDDVSVYVGEMESPGVKGRNVLLRELAVGWFGGTTSPQIVARKSVLWARQGSTGELFVTDYLTLSAALFIGSGGLNVSLYRGREGQERETHAIRWAIGDESCSAKWANFKMFDNRGTEPNPDLLDTTTQASFGRYHAEVSTAGNQEPCEALVGRPVRGIRVNYPFAPRIEADVSDLLEDPVTYLKIASGLTLELSADAPESTFQPETKFQWGLEALQCHSMSLAASATRQV